MSLQRRLITGAPFNSQRGYLTANKIKLSVSDL